MSAKKKFLITRASLVINIKTSTRISFTAMMNEIPHSLSEGIAVHPLARMSRVTK
jgi:hypothetical protein